MNISDVKIKVDEMIGTKQPIKILSPQGFILHGLEVLNNKIIEEKNICLTYFKDVSYCCNSLLLLETNLVTKGAEI